MPNGDPLAPEDFPYSIRRARPRRATVPLHTLLSWGRGEVSRAGLSATEAVWLLQWATDSDSLLTAPQEVGIRAAEVYRSGIAQRRSRIPLQHIMGRMSFRSITLRAGPGVFSTRPETELLVDYAVRFLAEQESAEDSTVPSREVRFVADLCAGSGAIGLSIAKEVPRVAVTLVEMDTRAASYLYGNLEFCKPYAPDSSAGGYVGDALTSLGDRDGEFSLVVSNPPYVGSADAPTQPEAQVDPPMALYGGGEDGLVIPRGIVSRAFQLLRTGGVLLMEHGEGQGEELVGHALSVGFTNAHTLDDLTGRPRFLSATKGTLSHELS